MTAPPNKAPPSVRNRRRDAEVTFLPMSVGVVIVILCANRCAWNKSLMLGLSQRQGILTVTTERGGACRGLLRLIRSCRFNRSDRNRLGPSRLKII